LSKSRNVFNEKGGIMKTKISLIILLSFVLVSGLDAQITDTGSLRGMITDSEGDPLPGVRISVKGPTLMGTEGAVTNERGIYRIPVLPPGTFEVTVEMDGFQTIKRENVIIRSGQIIELNFSMVQSEIKEEVTVTAPSPTVDVVQTKKVETLTSSILRRLPTARNLFSIIQIAPGVQDRYIHGGTRNDYGFMVDGVSLLHDYSNYPQFTPSWEIMEEVEFVTGAASAEAYHSAGGYLNVITKSGGNNFSGSAGIYFTNEDLTEILTPDEKLRVLGISKPQAAIYEYDANVDLGGPIIKDRLWFFLQLRREGYKRRGVFRPTVIEGISYETYDRPYTSNYFYAKLTFQLTKNLKSTTLASYQDWLLPYRDALWYATKDGAVKQNGTWLMARQTFTWILNRNTILDIRLGINSTDAFNGYTDEARQDSPQFVDGYTGYNWGSCFYQINVTSPAYRATAKITRFMDSFLGADHEFKAGFEYDGYVDDSTIYKEMPLIWHYYNQNPYYYRGLYGLSGPDPEYGDGWLGFAAIAPNKGDSLKRNIYRRIGFFIQDSFVIKQRLAVNLGLRYDNIRSGFKAMTKDPVDWSVALAVGETYFTPVYGFNPYAAMEYDAWENALPYSFLGPTVGASYDIFGDGKTAVKASFGLYGDGAPTWHYYYDHPAGTPVFDFYWWDLNNNGQPDAPPQDTYKHFGATPLTMKGTGWKKIIDPDVKAGYTQEATIHFEHELFSDFRLTLGYIHKSRKNSPGNPLYDVANDREWNTVDKAPEYWVPFTTTVPAVDDFPAKTITIYYRSINSPAWFSRMATVPESKMIYDGFEFSFNKRMSKGWQLGGSFVYSHNRGNYNVTTLFYSNRFTTPNEQINAYGDMPAARPILIKLYGTFVLPYRFIFSFFYNHQSGTPWGRTVTVVPPSDWAIANNVIQEAIAVKVEPSGTRWNQSSDMLDFRFEKEFSFDKYGKLGVYLDVFNILGAVVFSTSMNPGGTWRPTEPNTTTGVYTKGWTGITGHEVGGTRNYKISLRYSF
jgi:hypothetical protein